MGNNDKEKKKTSAKPPAKSKHAQKLTSKAASRKDHIQDDTDSLDNGGSGDDGEDGDDLQEDIKSVF